MAESEDNYKLAAAVSHYGVGTRSYNRSPEKREMDRQRKEATEKWANSHEEFIIYPRCRCLSFNLAHDLRRHRELRDDSDWRTEAQRKANKKVIHTP